MWLTGKCLSSMHTQPTAGFSAPNKSGMVVQASLVLGRQRQEDQKSQVVFCYAVSSRPVKIYNGRHTADICNPKPTEFRMTGR